MESYSKSLVILGISQTLMGICVYAGAAQFMAVGMLGAGVGLFEIAISTFFLNSRHLFYGLALLNMFWCMGFKKVLSNFWFDR